MSDRQFLLLLRVVLVVFTLAALLFALNSKSTHVRDGAERLQGDAGVVHRAARRRASTGSAPTCRARCSRWCSAWCPGPSPSGRPRTTTVVPPQLVGLALLDRRHGARLARAARRSAATPRSPRQALIRSSSRARLAARADPASRLCPAGRLRVALSARGLARRRAVALRLPERALAALRHRLRRRGRTSRATCRYGFLAVAALRPRAARRRRVRRCAAASAAVLSLVLEAGQTLPAGALRHQSRRAVQRRRRRARRALGAAPRAA